MVAYIDTVGAEKVQVDFESCRALIFPVGFDPGNVMMMVRLAASDHPRHNMYLAYNILYYTEDSMIIWRNMIRFLSTYPL
jgi:hypothetical protein